jgi:hypothetical protein
MNPLIREHLASLEGPTGSMEQVRARAKAFEATKEGQEALRRCPKPNGHKMAAMEVAAFQSSSSNIRSPSNLVVHDEDDNCGYCGLKGHGREKCNKKAKHEERGWVLPCHPDKGLLVPRAWEKKKEKEKKRAEKKKVTAALNKEQEGEKLAALVQGAIAQQMQALQSAGPIPMTGALPLQFQGHQTSALNLRPRPFWNQVTEAMPLPSAPIILSQSGQVLPEQAQEYPQQY